jgi:hypothetical protein
MKLERVINLPVAGKEKITLFMKESTIEALKKLAVEDKVSASILAEKILEEYFLSKGIANKE